MEADINRKDIDLVCNFELSEIKKHIRNNKGVHYNDFVKFKTIKDDENYVKLMNSHL